MQQPNNEQDVLPIGTAGLLGWVLLVCAIMLYFDFSLPGDAERSDFVSCLYTGASIFASGRFQDLYTPLTMTTFRGAPCDIAAHQLLPHLPPGLIAEFNYCPLVACLLVPFTLLPPNIALMAWQALSLAALYASICFLSDEKKSDRGKLFALCLLFFPTVITVWIGQTDLVFGVFFLSLGLRLLLSKREFAAGAICSIALLKPQFCIIIGLMAMVLLFRRRWHYAAGAAAGAAVLLGLNLLVGGVELFKSWLWTVKLCEMIFTDPNTGLQNHLMVSLPGNLLLAYASNPLTKPVIYATSAAVGCFAIWRCLQVAKELGDDRQWISYSAIVGTFIMPFMVPNFMLYDLPMFIYPALVILQSDLRERLQLPWRRLFLAMIFGVNAYVIILFSAKPFANPLVLVALFAVVLYFLLRPSKRPGPEPATQPAAQ